MIFRFTLKRLAHDPARRGSASAQGVAIRQVLSKAKNNMAGVDFVCLRCASAVLANGSMSFNQSGDCPARSAPSKPKAKPQSLPRQCDIRRALIEADLVDCMWNKGSSSNTERNCLAMPS